MEDEEQLERDTGWIVKLGKKKTELRRNQKAQSRFNKKRKEEESPKIGKPENQSKDTRQNQTIKLHIPPPIFAESISDIKFLKL